MGKALTEVSQEILELAELCRSNSGIDPELYKVHDVKRGLRDLNGNAANPIYSYLSPSLLSLYKTFTSASG